MKKWIITLALASGVLPLLAQKEVKKIDAQVKMEELRAHLYFLAADELRGRNTGTVENEIAARYIAERFRAWGVQTAPGQSDYFQPVGLIKSSAPRRSEVAAAGQTFRLWDDLIFLTASDVDDSAEVVFANFGLEEDLKDLDLKGKILVTKAGNGSEKGSVYGMTMKKMQAAREKGAIALLELYRPSAYPWKLLVNYLSGDRYVLDSQGELSTPFPAAWLLDGDGERLAFFKEMHGKKMRISISGAGDQRITVPNVVGYVPGTDPKLKEEFVLISAHLDHVGVKNLGQEDSIWNGARDNGIGTSNLLTAAEYFAKNPTKRSIIFLACNAEEVGLLGSEWYAANPLFPLNKTVFDLNTDTGGYNDTSKVTVVGFNRTSVTPYFVQAAKAFGLTAIDDPLPEENYYDRSDNVSFAAKGIPSVSYDPGYTSMNEEITKYYHQPADEAHTLDYEYLTRYSKSFVLAVTLIANHTGDIFWTPGDKYESAGKALYER